MRKQDSEEEKPISPTEFIERAEYISDVNDEIDRLIEQAKGLRGQEKKESLRKAQALIDAFEVHIGREVYNTVI